MNAKERKQKELLQLGRQATTVAQERDLALATLESARAQIELLNHRATEESRDAAASRRERDEARAALRVCDVAMIQVRGEICELGYRAMALQVERDATLEKLAHLEAQERDARKLRRQRDEARKLASERLTDWHRAIALVRRVARAVGVDVLDKRLAADVARYNAEVAAAVEAGAVMTGPDGRQIIIAREPAHAPTEPTPELAGP